MQGVTLLGIYLVVAIIGQAIGFVACTLVERTVPWAGMPVFLAFFFGMLVLAWPIAVALMDRFAPAPAKLPIQPRPL
jgi:hypothetical protein